MTKKLGEILTGIASEIVQGDIEMSISGITVDSRKVSPGYLFMAIQGTQTDGHQYINEVLSKGVRAILVSQDVEVHPEVTVIRTEDTRLATALVAQNFYDHPDEKCILVGTTGTNGKTSISFLLYQLFSNLGYKCGLISTIGIRIASVILPASLTTPDPIQFYRQLSEMVEHGCVYVFMEVSSHALDQHRVTGAKFNLGIFSNLTHDHLDYHGTFAEYLRVKKSFFDTLDASSYALVNIDDRNGQVMLQNSKAGKFTYALQHPADFKGKVIANERTGLQLQLNQTEVFTQLVGLFNAQNLLAVYGAARILDQDHMEILQAMSALKAPPGRFEVFQNVANKVTALVDYAHTPDALQKVLETIVEIKWPDDQVITVVGCGGNRDASKRPKMAAIACRYSNRVVLTSDNPRDEEPEAIIREMEEGVPADKAKQVLSITNRAEAIKTACMLGQQQSIILIAGKGHETYQEISGKKLPFDDRELVQACLN